MFRIQHFGKTCRRVVCFDLLCLSSGHLKQGARNGQAEHVTCLTNLQPQPQPIYSDSVPDCASLIAAGLGSAGVRKIA
jgi:hypothetical protein